MPSTKPRNDGAPRRKSRNVPFVARAADSAYRSSSGRGLAAGVAKVKRLLSRICHRSSTLLLLIVFAAETGLGVLIIWNSITADVEVRRMYTGSVRGLRGIGEMQYQAQETRRTNLYALTTNDANLQVDYADQSREADRRVTQGIAEYLAQAQTHQEIEVGKILANDWNAYLKIRDDVLSLILEGSTEDAVREDRTSGIPRFERVRQDLERIKRIYDEQASRQLVVITDSSRRSAIIVLVFALFLASVVIWTIEKSEVRAAARLAKLQMDFVASFSHELHTPIASILSAGQNVEDGIVSRKEDLTSHGSIITAQARQLRGLVDEILLYASMTHRKDLYVLRSLTPSQILEHVLRNTAGVVQGAGFTLEQQIESGLPWVSGDLAALSHCLQNLIVNAIKYSNKDHWIGLSADVAEAKDQKKEVQISVQDHGIGISSSELLRVFEPFYRSPQVSAAQIHGTGLGLAVAKRIAEAMGGRLSVISEVNVGSTFTLHLPVAEEKEDQLAIPTSGSSWGA